MPYVDKVTLLVVQNAGINGQWLRPDGKQLSLTDPGIVFSRNNDARLAP